MALPMQMAVAACIFLATKVEEVAGVFHCDTLDTPYVLATICMM